ncbi:MAG TPA: circularly permuted type 2 ATP-grasp protein, partial [Pirellula sp.]|nr:circularly permuted type 2 ATP-grasp protein [Pirellula sp.]
MTNQQSQFDRTTMEQVNTNFLNGDPLKISHYDSRGFFDEMFTEAGQARLGVEFLVDKLAALSPGELQRRQRAAEHELLNMGITFNVYGHSAGSEKVWPFDLIPRVIQEV